jgi:hypothetical protein
LNRENQKKPIRIPLLNFNFQKILSPVEKSTNWIAFSYAIARTVISKSAGTATGKLA